MKQLYSGKLKLYYFKNLASTSVRYYITVPSHEPKILTTFDMQIIATELFHY